MVDPKVVELSIYNQIPHLLIPVITEPMKAAAALKWAVAEMIKRYNKFAKERVRDIEGYNKKQEKEKRMPKIVILIDELADLMMVAAKEVEDSICRLAQMGRAAGMHLVIATQRPSVDVITGLIKANIPSRIAFAVSSGIDSRTILDSVGAEKLLGKGDMLYAPIGSTKPMRVQGAFISDEEIAKIVDYIKRKDVSETSEMIEREIESSLNHNEDKKGGYTEDEDERDPKLIEAIEKYMNTDGTVSSSMKEREKLEQQKEEEKKKFMINKGSLNITEKFVEEIMDYTIDEPYFMDTIEDMILDDEISLGYIMRKYSISEERSKKIMDTLSSLNLISMKDYYSAIVTITKEEWNRIEEIFDNITE